MAANSSLPPVLYHYTTMGALFKIIDGIKERNNHYYFELFATHYRFVNDPTEYKFVDNCVSRAVQKYADNVASEAYKKYSLELDSNSENPFVVSLSAAKDDLAMWRMYGDNGRGVAIGINAANIANTSKIFNNCDYFDEESLIEMFVENGVGENYYKISKNLFGNSVECQSQDAKCLQHMRIFGKHSCYSVENEWRIVRFANLRHCEYREVKGVVVPYLRIQIPFKFLKEIVLGPCLDMELHKFSLQNFINKKVADSEGKNPHIEFSSVPYVVR